MTISKIVIYDGAGICKVSSNNIYNKMIKYFGSHNHVMKINEDDIISKYEWYSNKNMVVVGGGNLKEIKKGLGVYGIKNLNDFINKKGGKYLGIGSGAFLACENNKYKYKNTTFKNKTCPNLNIKLFKGCATGPVYKDYYESLRPCEIDIFGKKKQVYVYGGGYTFTKKCNFTDGKTEIIATYSYPQKKINSIPAIIKQKHKSGGYSLLCGVEIDEIIDIFSIYL